MAPQTYIHQKIDRLQEGVNEAFSVVCKPYANIERKESEGL